MDLESFLLLGAGLISLGLWGVLGQRSIVMILLGLELMLNGVLVSTVALWHYVAPHSAKGQLFVLLVLLLTALQAALGCALLIAVYRSRRSAAVDAVGELRG